MNIQEFAKTYSNQIINITKLSIAERWVFDHVGSGLSTKEIANIKGNIRSVRTIESYLIHIQMKLEISGTRNLRNFAIQFKCYCEFAAIKPKVKTTHEIHFGGTVFKTTEKIKTL